LAELSPIRSSRYRPDKRRYRPSEIGQGLSSHPRKRAALLKREFGRLGPPAKPSHQCRHSVIRQMIEELAHGVDSHATLRAAGNDNSLPPLGDTRWIINKVGKVVAVNLALDGGEQFGLEHRTPRVAFGEERDHRIIDSSYSLFPSRQTRSLECQLGFYAQIKLNLSAPSSHRRISDRPGKLLNHHLSLHLSFRKACQEWDWLGIEQDPEADRHFGC
jgi:hypothetical protein